MVIRPQNLGYLALMCVAVAGLLSGCAALPASHSADLAQEVSSEPDVRGEVVVELRDNKGSRFLKAPLRGNMFVDDALKGSGALEEFNRMDVVVVRALPGGEKLRMPVTYNPDTREVNSATNFALHPGDVVEVRDDPRTLLSRMIDSAFSTLGPIAKSQRR